MFEFKLSMEQGSNSLSKQKGAYPVIYNYLNHGN